MMRRDTRKDAELVTIEYDEIRVDDDRHKSILFLIGDREVWLPRSLVEVNEDDKTVRVPQWKVELEGLEGDVV
jgi:hypothetical protein